MNGYKLVPVEPTQEMVEAGEYAQYTGCYVSGIYADMLAAAPAVQGEPVAVVVEEVFGSDGTSDFISARLPVGTKLYTAPQPAVQKPDVTLLLSLLSHARCNACDGSGGLYDNHGQPHQCQWCRERSEALAAHRKQETSHENQ